MLLSSHGRWHVDVGVMLFHGASSNLLVHKLHNTIALAYVQMCKDLRHGVLQKKTN
jgi:hypothetical protein